MVRLIIFSIAVGLVLQITPGYSSKCATLYNSKSYQGSPLSLADGTKQPYYRHLSFVPNSVRVTDGCFLTIFDVYGQRKTVESDKDDLGWNYYQVLDAGCCECEGCKGAERKLGAMCAILYENARCDSCSGGFNLEMKDGDRARNLGPLNNKMTSISVRPGCTLSVFTKPEFDGWRFNFTSSNNMLGENWYRQISSAVCGCNPNSVIPTSPSATRPPMTLPTVLTTRPTWTLPTVPTTRPVMTLPTVPTTKWPPMTLPTVWTARPTWTLPTVPTTRPVITLPTVPTTKWPPMTLPTVWTTRPAMTLPTVPTTRPVMTLPTVWTTRPAMTLPTVPTTRPVMTLPTVPTTQRPPITLPTISTSDSSSGEWSLSEEEDEDDEYLGGNKSDEIITTTTTTPKPTTTKKVTTTTEEPDEDIDWDW